MHIRHHNTDEGIPFQHFQGHVDAAGNDRIPAFEADDILQFLQRILVIVNGKNSQPLGVLSKRRDSSIRPDNSSLSRFSLRSDHC